MRDLESYHSFSLSANLKLKYQGLIAWNALRYLRATRVKSDFVRQQVFYDFQKKNFLLYKKIPKLVEGDYTFCLACV